MKIPAIREALLLVADGLDNDDQFEHAIRVRELVNEMYRRPAIRRGREIVQRIPHSVQREIREYAAANPEEAYYDIAIKFGVRNIGRISEFCAGYKE